MFWYGIPPPNNEQDIGSRRPSQKKKNRKIIHQWRTMSVVKKINVKFLLPVYILTCCPKIIVQYYLIIYTIISSTFSVTMYLVWVSDSLQVKIQLFYEIDLLLIPTGILWCQYECKIFFSSWGTPTLCPR